MRSSSLLKTLSLVLALWGVAALVGCGAAGDYGVREGQLAPDFSGLTVQGDAVQLSALRGKPTVVVFWASWCGPCMQEIPHVNAVVDAYGDEVAVLGINMGEDARTVEGVVASRGMRYPSLLDPRTALATKFAVQSIPLVVVLDAEGRIRYRGNGLPTRSTALIDGLLSSS